jgi:hypothetical protein
MSKEVMNRPTEATQITTVEDILAKMRNGVKATHEIKLRDAVIPVRVLSVDEMNAIRREALITSLASKGDDTDINLQKQKSTLKLASNLNGGPTLSEKLLGQLTTDEINYLYSEYVAVMERVNPSIETIPNEEFRLMVEALKKNLAFPKDLSLRQLKAICSAFQDMIQRPANQELPTGN